MVWITLVRERRLNEASRLLGDEGEDEGIIDEPSTDIYPASDTQRLIQLSYIWLHKNNS